MVPIVVFLICIGWRILKRRKAEEKEFDELMTVKQIDPDESVRINSDEDSLPYKKDIPEDSPEPEPELADPVRVVDDVGIPYDATYDPTPPPPPPMLDQTRTRQWAGETEIN